MEYKAWKCCGDVPAQLQIVSLCFLVYLCQNSCMVYKIKNKWKMYVYGYSVSNIYSGTEEEMQLEVQLL